LGRLEYKCLTLGRSALTLLVARIIADHANHTFAAHNLALAANFLD
jgi:hypothetical protein